MTDYVMTSTHVGGNVRNPALRKLIADLERSLFNDPREAVDTAAIVTYKNDSFDTYLPKQQSWLMNQAIKGINTISFSEVLDYRTQE